MWNEDMRECDNEEERADACVSGDKSECCTLDWQPPGSFGSSRSTEPDDFSMRLRSHSMSTGSSILRYFSRRPLSISHHGHESSETCTE